MPDTRRFYQEGGGGWQRLQLQAPQTVVFESKHTPKNGARVNRFWITSFQKWCTDHPLFLEPPIKFEYKILLITGILIFVE